MLQNRNIQMEIPMLDMRVLWPMRQVWRTACGGWVKGPTTRLALHFHCTGQRSNHEETTVWLLLNSFRLAYRGQFKINGGCGHLSSRPSKMPIFRGIAYPAHILAVVHSRPSRSALDLWCDCPDWREARISLPRPGSFVAHEERGPAHLRRLLLLP